MSRDGAVVELLALYDLEQVVQGYQISVGCIRDISINLFLSQVGFKPGTLPEFGKLMP